MLFDKMRVVLVLLIACGGADTTHDSFTDASGVMNPSNSSQPSAQVDAAAARPDAASPAALEFRPSRIEFITAEAFDNWDVSLVNSSSSPVEPKVELTGSSAFELISSGCKAPLPPRQSCDLRIRFLPKSYGEWKGAITATAGNLSATATISSTAKIGGLLHGRVAHWTFEDLQGSTVKDVSGMLNTGVFVQGTAPDAVAATASKAMGHSGFGLDLSGQDTWVRVRPSVSIDSSAASGSFTVSAWIKPRPLTGKFGRPKWVISRNYNGEVSHAFALGLDGERPSFGHNHYRLSAENRAPTDQWTHIAGTYDSNTMTLYVNGTFEKENVIGTPIAPASTDVVIGAGQLYEKMTDFFNGVIDDVSVYNTALTAEQVNQLAQRP